MPKSYSWIDKPFWVLIVEIRVLFADAAGVADAATARLQARRAPHIRNRRNLKLSSVLPEDALRVHHARLIDGQLHRDIDFHTKNSFPMRQSA